MNGRPTGFSCYQYRQGSSSHTLSRASASVDFALLSDRWKCFAVSFSGWYTSSSKPKRYKRYACSRRSIRCNAVWISSWVSFAIYMLRILCSGVSDKFMLAFVLVFYNLIQTDDTSQILRFKSGVPSADVVYHSIADRRCCVGQKLVAGVRSITSDTFQQS